EPMEKRLQQLDSSAWQQLIKKCVPFVTSCSRRRGHHQLINHLEEARGYALLVRRGYAGIGFIECGKRGSPDLLAESEMCNAVLEVKCVNNSDEHIDWLAAWPPQVRDVVHGLSAKFKQKLIAAVEEAREQLEAFGGPVDKKIVL